MNKNQSQRATLHNLFTFGFQQMQEVFNSQKNDKFPFLRNAKIKKSPLLYKLVSQQRQKISSSRQNVNQSNFMQKKQVRNRIMSQCFKRTAFSVDKNKAQAQLNDSSSIQRGYKKKSSLPKVLRDVFPQPKRASNKVKIQPKNRYLVQQSAQLLKYSENQQINLIKPQISIRPMSVMLLSDNCCQFVEHKAKTIQQNRNRLYSKAYNRPQKFRADLNNSRMVQNIIELKKIYC